MNVTGPRIVAVGFGSSGGNSTDDAGPKDDREEERVNFTAAKFQIEIRNQGNNGVYFGIVVTKYDFCDISSFIRW